MEVKVPGHQYLLKSHEGGDPQILKFIHKEPIDGSSELKTICDGTTNEEVLEMLIDRIKFQNEKFPSLEIRMIIKRLEQILYLFNEMKEPGYTLEKE